MTEVLDYLEDILDGVEKIKRYTQEISYHTLKGVAFSVDSRSTR